MCVCVGCQILPNKIPSPHEHEISIFTSCRATETDYESPPTHGHTRFPLKNKCVHLRLAFGFDSSTSNISFIKREDHKEEAEDHCPVLLESLFIMIRVRMTVHGGLR